MATEPVTPQSAADLTMPAVVRAVVDALGETLVAVLAEADDTRQVGQWLRGEHPPRPTIQQRLRAALEIVWLLGQREGPGTIRAWWGGMNPDLGDEAPVLVLARDPARVRAAALAFLAQ